MAAARSSGGGWLKWRKNSRGWRLSGLWQSAKRKYEETSAAGDRLRAGVMLRLHQIYFGGSLRRSVIGNEMARKLKTRQWKIGGEIRQRRKRIEETGGESL